MSDASQPRPFKNYPDLSDPVEQERLSPAAVGAFANIATIWSLNDAQALGLLGVVTASTLLEWKTGIEGPGFSIPVRGLVLGLFLFQSDRA